MALLLPNVGKTSIERPIVSVATVTVCDVCAHKPTGVLGGQSKASSPGGQYNQTVSTGVPHIVDPDEAGVVSKG
jgi:hypothetical protein